MGCSGIGTNPECDICSAYVIVGRIQQTTRLKSKSWSYTLHNNSGNLKTAIFNVMNIDRDIIYLEMERLGAFVDFTI
jgi:hypothetical protein